MGKILLFISFFLGSIFCVDAQSLYGITYNGGNDGGGTIGRVFPTINNLSVSKSLESCPANPAFTNLVQGNDGRLYGMTSNGGSYGYGVIFSFEPSSSTFKKLKDFNYADGANPLGSLTLGNDGKLFGMTSNGGLNGYGVIFSFDPASSNYSVLLEFEGSNGANPLGSLIQASDGKLYGMTSKGDNNDNGVIFSFDPASSSYNVLQSCNEGDGSNPVGNLIQANDGKLYGMASRGGSSFVGSIFSIDPATFTYSKLFDFDDLNGNGPAGSLIQTSDGKLCGMTLNGGANSSGVIFSFDPASSTYTKLKDFDYNTGYWPQGSLIQGSDGKVYGMTSAGGDNNSGVMFSFDLSSGSYAKLKDFADALGSGPLGSLMQTSDGKLFGMTAGGGRAITSPGVIFSFDLLRMQYMVEKEFGINDNGSNISGSMLQGKDGKLYGMATNGGSRGAGVIFSFDPFTATYKKLRDFDKDNGSHPYGGLLHAIDGKLYGMTPYGGIPVDQDDTGDDLGVIFSYNPQTGDLTRLMKFDMYTHYTGGHPYGSLLQSEDGKLYGMTSAGGGGYRGSGSGVIFSFDPASSTYTRLQDFANFSPLTGLFMDNLNGAYPYGNLTKASDGKLYGMTSQGGNNDRGLIFAYDVVTLSYTKVIEFDGNNGANPYGSLLKADDGKLYGMTYGGGSNDAGVIFSFDPATSIFTKLLDLDFTHGANPYGSLMQSSNGNLYGMTSTGGNYDYGVIFSFNPTNSTYTKMIDYDGENGASPYFGAAFIEIPESLPLLVDLLGFKGNNNGNINHLSWEVENEQSVKYYELERGTDGQKFDDIAQIKAMGVANYRYDDLIAGELSPLYFYRLKMLDINGDFKYSKAIKVWLSSNHPVLAVNPNPVTDKLRVTVKSQVNDKVFFTLTDLTGRQIFSVSKSIFPGSNLLEVGESKSLSSGTYLLTMMSAQGRQSIKVVLAH